MASGEKMHLHVHLASATVKRESLRRTASFALLSSFLLLSASSSFLRLFFTFSTSYLRLVSCLVRRLVGSERRASRGDGRGEPAGAALRPLVLLFVFLSFLRAAISTFLSKDSSFAFDTTCCQLNLS